MATSRSKISSSTTASKFIPNLEQLNDAIADLPDASDYNDDSFTTTLIMDSIQQQIMFTKKPIKRGSKLVYRWIYEGKILIRNQDKDGVF